MPNLGASGAIAGVLGGYLMLFPRARVITVIFIIFFFTILELPALLILGFWFLQQVLFGYFDLSGPDDGGGVAYWAHIGGFLWGLLAIRLFADDRKRRQQLQAGASGPDRRANRGARDGAGLHRDPGLPDAVRRCSRAVPTCW